MLVVDARKGAGRPTALVGVEAAVGEVRQWVNRVLERAG